MTDASSIRLRLIRRLHGALDHVVQRLAQELREHEVHSDPGAYRDLGNVSLYARCSECQVQVPVNDAGINEQIGEAKRNLDRLRNDPLYIAQSHRLAAAQNHLVAHQVSPLGFRDFADGLSSLNAKLAGVES